MMWSQASGTQRGAGTFCDRYGLFAESCGEEVAEERRWLGSVQTSLLRENSWGEAGRYELGFGLGFAWVGGRNRSLESSRPALHFETTTGPALHVLGQVTHRLPGIDAIRAGLRVQQTWANLVLSGCDLDAATPFCGSASLRQIGLVLSLDR